MSLDPYSAISSAVVAERVGTPVSARIFDHTADGPDGIESSLARGLVAAEAWLKSPIIRLAALGSASSGQISVLAACAGGQTSLVSAGLRGNSAGLWEAIVLGTRGMLSWEPDFSSSSSSSIEVASLLLAAVHRSLDLGQPVNFDGEPPEEPAPKRRAHASVDMAPAPAPAKILPQEPPYGILLVSGNQTHQENYARSFAVDPRARIMGLADEREVSPRRKELNERLARELGIPFFADLAEGLARPDVHIICICAEPERRGRIIVRAAEAKKHLYLDKPLAATAQEAEAIVAAVARAGVVSQMFTMAHLSPAERLHRLVKSRAVGDPSALHFDLFFAKGHPASLSPRSRMETAEPRRFEAIEAKREFYNIGVYPLATLFRLGYRVRRVWTVTGNYFFAEHLREDMEDFGAALLELEGGAVASLLVGRTGWRSHPLGGMNRTCLAGADGAISIDACRPRLEVWSDDEPWTAPRRHPEDPMGFWSSTVAESGARPKQGWILPSEISRSDVALFLDCVEQGRAASIPAQAAAAILNVQLAAYASAATNRFVAP